MKEILLFVSSTFSDMIDERELLVRSVFPRVKHFCKMHRLIFRTIDLRWGITKEQAEDLKQTIDICLRRVNDSVPLFLSFLGQRYGWVPTKDYLKVMHCDRKKAIKQYRGRSATELEILQALDSAFFEGEKKHCVFFFKDPSYLDTLPDEKSKARYVESTHKGQKKLCKLKARLLAEGRDCTEYTAEFLPLTLPAYLSGSDNDGETTVVQTNFQSGGRPLADVLVEKLTQAILETVGEDTYAPCYPGETNQQYLLNQYSHSAPIVSVDAYLQSRLAWERGSLHGLYMPESQGKSCAMARLASYAQERNPWVFYRFLGGDAHTDSIKSVLHTLAIEICARLDKPYPKGADHITDLDLLQDGMNVLCAQGEDVVLLLDGINKTRDTYFEWLDFLRSLPIGHAVFSTEHQKTRVNDAPYWDTLEDSEITTIIRYHFERFGKSLDPLYAEVLVNASNGMPVHIMHAVRYLTRFSTFESIEGDVVNFVTREHLDGIRLLDDEYAKLQPLCRHWREHEPLLRHLLSYTTYVLMICRKGVTFEELSDIIADVAAVVSGPVDKTVLDECLNFELHLLSEELSEVDGVYTLKDPFYADYLICELNRVITTRLFYFERVLAHFVRFAAGEGGCVRHLFTVNEILENVEKEDLIKLLRLYFFTKDYVQAVIRICGYSYLTQSVERYYVQSLGWKHLLAPSAEGRYELRKILKKMPTPQNEIGLLRTLLQAVPVGLRQNADTALSLVVQILRANKLEQRADLPLTTAFYESVKDVPARYIEKSVCLQLHKAGNYQNGKATVHLDTLYACGKDDRVYAHDLLSGECDTVIQLERGEEPLCLFYFEHQIFIVGKKNVYVWHTVHRVKAAYDYVKNTDSPVKGAFASFDGDVAFRYESGLIKLYMRMQPLLEIGDLMGKNVEQVWTARRGDRVFAVALVKGEGYYVFENGKQVLVTGRDADAALRAERFAGVYGTTFYYAVSNGTYRTLDLTALTESEHTLDMHGSLRLSYHGAVTADEAGHVTVNGEHTGLKGSVPYAETVNGILYLIDSEGHLHAYNE